MGYRCWDEQGRERVVIIGGKGDQGLKKAIAYLRRKALPKVGRRASPSGLRFSAFRLIQPDDLAHWKELHKLPF